MAAAGGKPSDFDAYQGVCLLKIMGFMEDGDALAITFRGDSREGVRSETVLVVSQAGRVPDGATTRFVAMSPPSAPGQMALLFESADARDIMAFALAVENSMAACPCSSGGMSVPTTSVTPIAMPMPSDMPR